MFWLGTHETSWLERAEVPLMVSHHRLMLRQRLPRARMAWVLDSGGFTQLRDHGNWTISPDTYVTAVRRYADQIGLLQWAAPQDWMCEPWILRKTGLSLREHQYRSVISYIELMLRAPEIPWIPVVQGWELGDYLRHVEMYERMAVPLNALPVVGIGSVCRRQGTRGAVDVLVRLSEAGVKVHGFGLKATAVRALAPFLHSSDSLAWSYQARARKLRCGEPPRQCGNHLHYALSWRDAVLASMGTRSVQLSLAL